MSRKVEVYIAEVQAYLSSLIKQEGRAHHALLYI